MMCRWLLLGFAALGLAAAAIGSAAGQPSLGVEASRTIAVANALSARIRSYHSGPGRWTGATPPPASYCGTMREGEAVMKELARLASRATLYRLPDLALALQTAGNRLSDELDEEEIINQAADIPYTVYPCPVPTSAYPARALVLPLVDQRMLTCRGRANAAQATFAARRTLVQQCLRG
jgi:hypothetical protein